MYVGMVLFRTGLNPASNLANILWIIYRFNIYSSEALGSLKGHISFCIRTCCVGFLLVVFLHVWALKVKCFLLPKAASVQTLNKKMFSSCPFLISKNFSSLSRAARWRNSGWFLQVSISDCPESNEYHNTKLFFRFNTIPEQFVCLTHHANLSCPLCFYEFWEIKTQTNFALAIVTSTRQETKRVQVLLPSPSGLEEAWLKLMEKHLRYDYQSKREGNEVHDIYSKFYKSNLIV